MRREQLQRQRLMRDLLPEQRPLAIGAVAADLADVVKKPRRYQERLLVGRDWLLEKVPGCQATSTECTNKPPG